MDEANEIDAALNDSELQDVTDFNLKFRMHLAKRELDDHISVMEFLIKQSDAGQGLKYKLLELLQRMHGQEREYLFQDPISYLELYDDMPQITSNRNFNPPDDKDSDLEFPF